MATVRDCLSACWLMWQLLFSLAFLLHWGSTVRLVYLFRFSLQPRWEIEHISSLQPLISPAVKPTRLYLMLSVSLSICPVLVLFSLCLSVFSYLCNPLCSCCPLISSFFITCNTLQHTDTPKSCVWVIPVSYSILFKVTGFIHLDKMSIHLTTFRSNPFYGQLN